GDPEAIVHALALDPLTAAVLTLRQIRELATEMLEAQRAWLPQFEGRRVRPAPAIIVPPGITRAEVPIDPALAIAGRFDDLLRERPR
ncbi:MAG: alpha-glucosidase/alpha-galactosidase, partial [Chloroflexi bacterium]|nr:alpha-glucosidase/alpha-galactosidase [Chloroflexota bacterium]